MNEKGYQAIPKGTLLEQLADPWCAKSEREWAAARAIAELTAALQERDETIKELQALLRTHQHFLQEAHDEYDTNRHEIRQSAA